MSILGWIKILRQNGNAVYGYALGRPAFLTTDPDFLIEVWLGDKDEDGVPLVTKVLATQCTDLDGCMPVKSEVFPC